MHFRDGFCGDKGSIIDGVSHCNVSCEDRIPAKVAKWRQISQNRFIYCCRYVCAREPSAGNLADFHLHALAQTNVLFSSHGGISAGTPLSTLAANSRCSQHSPQVSIPIEGAAFTDGGLMQSVSDDAGHDETLTAQAADWGKGWNKMH